MCGQGQPDRVILDVRAMITSWTKACSRSRVSPSSTFSALGRSFPVVRSRIVLSSSRRVTDDQRAEAVELCSWQRICSLLLDRFWVAITKNGSLRM